MQTQQVLQQVMKKKKKKTSGKCYYVAYYLMRGASILFALPSSDFIHLIVQGASLLFVLPLNLSPIQYKVSLMMIGAKIIFTGASKVHKLVFVMCRVCWCITPKKKILKL
jgi:hypothetical protein